MKMHCKLPWQVVFIKTGTDLVADINIRTLLVYEWLKSGLMISSVLLQVPIF